MDHQSLIPPPPQRTSDHHPPATGLTRRTFLQSSATALVAGLVATRLGSTAPAHADELGTGKPQDERRALPLWAATRDRDGRYLALSGDAEHPRVAELVVAGDGTVLEGAATPLELPRGFAPLGLLAVADRLLVAGALVREEVGALTTGEHDLLPGDRGGIPSDAGFLEAVEGVTAVEVRPQVVELTRDGLRTVFSGEEVPGAFGLATTLAALPGDRVGVLVEGAMEPEQAYNDITWFAESAAGGRSGWDVATVATGLGEGRRSHVAAARDRLVAVTVDQDGASTVHERAARPASPWRALSVDGPDGPVLAAVASGASVDVVAGVGGAVARLRHDPGRSSLQRGRTVAVPDDHLVSVVPVSGTAGEVVAIGRTRAVLDS